MSTWQAFRVVIVALFVVACSLADEEPERPEFVAEVIVKFANDQGMNHAIVDSMNKGGELSDDINVYASRLSSQLGVPVSASRITSGRELILEVRSDVLLADLAERLSEYPGVAESNRTSSDRSTPYRRDEVLITFEPDTDMFRTLQSVDPTGEAPNQDVAKLTAALTSEFQYPVSSRLLDSGELALSVDTGLLTLRLVEALRERDDVDYAQSNFVMKYD